MAVTSTRHRALQFSAFSWCQTDCAKASSQDCFFGAMEAMLSLGIQVQLAIVLARQTNTNSTYNVPNATRVRWEN